MYSAPLRSVQALDRLQICLTWAFVFDVYFYLHYRFYLCVHKFSICGYVRNGLKAAETLHFKDTTDRDLQTNAVQAKHLFIQRMKYL